MPMEDFPHKAPPLVRAKFHKEALYLVLEYDDKDKQTDVHELIHYRTHQLHADDFRYHHPCYNERKHTNKDIERARLFHRAIHVE